MTKIRFNQNLYDASIQDGNLILDSLHETFIFPNGGKELTEDAEREFYSLRYAGQRLNSFISEYIDSTVQTWVDTHKEDAQKVHDLSKILN